MGQAIWLVRHGQTPANLEGRFAGRTPEPLSPEGRRQALEAGKLLRGRGIGRIYASPLRRTMETAALIRQGLGEEGLEIVPDESFLEINIPPWEGRRREELLADPGLGYLTWRRAPHLFALPGCETLRQVQERAVRRALSLLEGEEVPLVVTHMAVVRVLLCHFMGLALAAYRSIAVPNARPFLVRREGEGFRVEGPL